MIDKLDLGDRRHGILMEGDVQPRRDAGLDLEGPGFGASSVTSVSCDCTVCHPVLNAVRGRLSTDLDFTRRTDISLDDLMIMMLGALDQSYRGLAFRFDKDKDWYLTDDGCSANPVCSHSDNERGVKIKLQVSTRERPIPPVVELPQLQQDYFRLLPFKAADIPCLAFDEVVAEKIRAASQRSKIRDLYDSGFSSLRRSVLKSPMS